MVDEVYEFQCPYCLARMSVLVDISEGMRQHFTLDCETCCRPINIELRLGCEGVEEFAANSEND